MQLRAWRQSKSLTLAQGAPLLDIPSIATLSQLETGNFKYLSMAMVAAIAAATDDAVTLDDHWVCWGKVHMPEFSRIRADRRAALRSFQFPAKPGDRHGTKEKKGPRR